MTINVETPNVPIAETPRQTAQPSRKEKQGGRPRQKINAQAAWERLQGGESLRRIARSLGVDHHTLFDHLRKAGLPTKVEAKQSEQAIAAAGREMPPVSPDHLSPDSALGEALASSTALRPLASPAALPETPMPYFATLNRTTEGLNLVPAGTKWVFLVYGKWNQQCTASYQPYCTAVSIDQWRDEYEDLPVFRDAERIFVIVSFDSDNEEITLAKQPEVYARWLDSIARAPRAIFEKCVVSRGLLWGLGALRSIARDVFLQGAREGRSLDGIVDSIVATYHFEPLPHWRDVEGMEELSAAPVIEDPGHSRFGGTESWRIGRFPHI